MFHVRCDDINDFQTAITNMEAIRRNVQMKIQSNAEAMRLNAQISERENAIEEQKLQAEAQKYALFAETAGDAAGLVSEAISYNEAKQKALRDKQEQTRELSVFAKQKPSNMRDTVKQTSGYRADANAPRPTISAEMPSLRQKPIADMTLEELREYVMSDRRYADVLNSRAPKRFFLAGPNGQEL